MRLKRPAIGVFVVFGVIVAGAALAWGSAAALFIWAPRSVAAPLQGTDAALPATPALPPGGVIQTGSTWFATRHLTIFVQTHRYREDGRLEYWLDGAWIDALERDAAEASDVVVEWHEAGWPFVGVHGGTTSTTPYFVTGPTRDGIYFGPVWLKDAGTPAARIVPLRPAWPGFSANTLIYAATGFVLIFLRFGLRRVVRRARHRCVHCGYPRGDSGRCTECGAVLE